MSQAFTRTQNNDKSIMGVCENTLDVSVCTSAAGPGGSTRSIFYAVEWTGISKSHLTFISKMEKLTYQRVWGNQLIAAKGSPPFAQKDAFPKQSSAWISETRGSGISI